MSNPSGISVAPGYGIVFRVCVAGHVYMLNLFGRRRFVWFVHWRPEDWPTLQRLAEYLREKTTS